MERLKTLEAKVRAILEECPQSRDNDRVLSLMVWNIFYGISPWTPVSEVMHNLSIPSQESIGRARRKIQATDEALRGSDPQERIRMEMQAEYIEYARGE